MKDLLITKHGKDEIKLQPQTKKAKKVFVEQGAGDEYVTGKEADLSKLVAWAVSHNLSVDTQLLIKVQPLLAPYQPKFKTDMGFDNIDETILNSEKNLEHLKAIDSFAAKNKQLLYRYFALPVADGTVYYQIIKVMSITVAVKRCVGIDLDDYSDNVLGERSTLPLKKARQLVENRVARERLSAK